MPSTQYYATDDRAERSLYTVKSIRIYTRIFRVEFIHIMFYLSAVLMFLNDLSLIGPSLVYNFC